MRPYTLEAHEPVRGFSDPCWTLQGWGPAAFIVAPELTARRIVAAVNAARPGWDTRDVPDEMKRDGPQFGDAPSLAAALADLLSTVADEHDELARDPGEPFCGPANCAVCRARAALDAHRARFPMPEGP